jgi:sugar phosphate isomerase/epimerase
MPTHSAQKIACVLFPGESIMHRRSFIKNSLYAGGALLGKSIFHLPNMAQVNRNKNMSTGVQIYSVRNELQSDIPETLKALRNIGYQKIEGYGLDTDGKILGIELAEFKLMVEDAGLSMPSCHCVYFEEDMAELMTEFADSLGLEYLVIPYLDDKQRKDYPAVAANLNTIAEILLTADIKLAYHNHDFEFVSLPDGTVPMQILMEQTDEGKVWYEADLYWIRKAGLDPLSWLDQYPGRIRLFHVKDADKQLNQTTVGDGIIDFATILEKYAYSIDHAFIEDERTDDPLQNLGKAYKAVQLLKGK